MLKNLRRQYTVLFRKWWTISTPEKKCNCENQIGVEIFHSYYFLPSLEIPHAFSTPVEYFVSGLDICWLRCVNVSFFGFRATKRRRNCRSTNLWPSSDRETSVLTPSPTGPARHGRKLSKLVWKFFFSGVEMFCFRSYSMIGTSHEKFPHQFGNFSFSFLSYASVEDFRRNFYQCKMSGEMFSSPKYSIIFNSARCQEKFFTVQNVRRNVQQSKIRHNF